MPNNLSELLALEESGRYQDALDLIRKSRSEIVKKFPTAKLNIELLEARLKIRLGIVQKDEFEATPSLPHAAQTLSKKNNSWSAIITMWKRHDYLEEQLAALRGQSIPPEEIIIILNENHISESKIREIGGNAVKIIRSDINSLYSRWAIAYIAKGEYVSVFDDDVIPGEHWIANAIRACSCYNALVGPSGRIYNPKGQSGYFKWVEPVSNPEGDNTIACAETDVYCDWVCNSYLFKREWVGHALSSIRYKDSFKTFDDIQLATSLFSSSGIRCVTPMQPVFDRRLHGSLKKEYGNDAHAIWKTNSDSHFAERKSYIESLIAGGYVPVQRRDELFRFHLIVPFGERAYLERCLLSIKGQQYKNFTCTLIDDCHDGADSMDVLRRVGLHDTRFRYIKTKEKSYPLRAREIATDMLAANLADVVVHVDGDDWLPYPDVLTRLNRIYRKGTVLATYGNSLCLRNYKDDNFSGYAHYEMSRKWNVAQKDSNAEVFPFRRIEESELSSGWKDAPWCGMHLRTFQFSKWISLNRKTFRDPNGRYLRVSTDAAILIPILESCKFQSIVFVPELGYVYQNATNTIHAKKEISPQEKQQALAAVRNADMAPNHHVSAHALIHGVPPVSPMDATVLQDMTVPSDKHYADSRLSDGKKRSSIVTIVTPDYITDAIVCLISYLCNVHDSCRAYVFIATDNKFELSICADLLKGSELVMLDPATLRHTGEQSRKLIERYKVDSDQYRWAMNPVVLLELLRGGEDSALFLDPDTYTVSDITDVHRCLARHPISVFPHFRDPDHEYLRGVLYKDGFFNGGVLAATPDGIPHLNRLFERCLHEMVKDPARNRWDDQKYFDIFPIEVENLHVNHDRGIDYNPWNYEPVEGLVAPSQRSVLLGSGYFVRHWHVSTMLVKNSIELKEKKFSVYRPIVSIYLLSLLYILVLVSARISENNSEGKDKSLRLTQRYDSIEKNLKNLLAPAQVDEPRRLLAMALQTDKRGMKSFLDLWADSVLKSICHDNFDLFARILGNIFPGQDATAGIEQRLRKQDLRYAADKVLASPEMTRAEVQGWLAGSDAEPIKKRLELLRASNMTYG